MIIGVDIDEILGEFYRGFLAWMKENQGITVSYDELYTYRLCTVLGESQEKSLERLHTYLRKHAKDLALVPGAQEGIRALSQKHTLYAITSRDKFSEQDTREWLRTHFEDAFEDVYFANHAADDFHVSKSHFTEQLGVDIMIEDYEGYALDIAHSGTTVVMLEKPWNNKEHHKNVFVMNSWKRIPHFVTDFAHRQSFEPGLYQHYKGAVYKAVRLVRDEDTLLSRVVYCNRDESMWWGRPLHDFYANVDAGKRFEKFSQTE